MNERVAEESLNGDKCVEMAGKASHSGHGNGRCEGLLEEHVRNFPEMWSMSWSHSKSHRIPPRELDKKLTRQGLIKISQRTPSCSEGRQEEGSVAESSADVQSAH